MQPWKVSIGLTVTASGVAAIFGLPELSYLKPHWKVLLRGLLVDHRPLWRAGGRLVRFFFPFTQLLDHGAWPI